MKYLPQEKTQREYKCFLFKKTVQNNAKNGGRIQAWIEKRDYSFFTLCVGLCL